MYLPGNLLYKWNNRNFEEKYLKKLEQNWSFQVL